MNVSSTEFGSSYSLKFEDRGRYLFASVKGARSTLEIATSYWYEIAQEAVRSNLKGCFDEDIAEMITMRSASLVTSLADLP